MDVFFPLFFVTALFIASFLMAVANIRYKRKKSRPTPPGPWNLPIIGSTHHLAFSLPQRKLRDLARVHGPVMLLRLGQVDVVVISSRSAAEEVTRTHDLVFSSRPELAAARTLSYNCTSIAFSPYGDYWKQLRKICVTELFTARQVKSFSGLRAEEVQNLVSDLDGAPLSVVNLSLKLRELFNTMVARAAFGSKCEQKERFIKVMKQGLRLVTGFSMADLFPSLGIVDVASGMRFKLERIHKEFDEILGEIIRDHQQIEKKKEEGSEEEDFVDVLLKVKERSNLDFPLTINNLKAVILDIFVGGTESSSVLVEWAMSELIRHPKMMAKAQDEVRNALKGRKTRPSIEEICAVLGELSFLKLVIKETLRLHPPAPLIPRICRETCTVGGYTIQAGTRLTINVWALGTDPDSWDDPESFKPERFEGSNSVDFKGVDYEFLPFGAGRRMCPGITYAMANIELALAALLLYFDWGLAYGMNPEELDMAETLSANIARKQELLLVATPYTPVTVV